MAAKKENTEESIEDITFFFVLLVSKSVKHFAWRVFFWEDGDRKGHKSK